MLTMTLTLNLTLLYFVAANVVGILAYVLVVKYMARREKRNIDAITSAISDYFQKNGVGVAVGCVSLRGNRRYTAFIESEPMKRFRLSHIVEITLIDYIHKVCNLELEKIYWRFPIKQEKQAAQGKDAYISEGFSNTEGFSNLKDLSKYELEESSLEMFQEASAHTEDRTPVKNADPKA